MGAALSAGMIGSDAGAREYSAGILIDAEADEAPAATVGCGMAMDIDGGATESVFGAAGASIVGV